MEVERLWTAKQLEDETGIPEATWRYYQHKGTGPRSFKIGGRRYWRPSDVAEWLADRYESEQPRQGVA